MAPSAGDGTTTMAGLLLKLRTWWETADRTQKAVTLFGGAFLVLLLGGTFFFASRPKMAMAYSGLSQADVGKVTLEIQKLGIAVDFDLQGNVSVPSEKVAEVRAKLAAAGTGPSSGTLGNEELSKLNLMIPPNVEQERLKSILEGELARSIQQIDGVANARVHLTRGERSAFASEKKPASASIFITEKAGGTIGSDSARAIAMMVTNAVTGLEANRVFVLDNAGRPLYDGSEVASMSGQASQKIEAERGEAMRRERDIQAKLDSVIGRGNSVVTVNVEMNFDKQTKEQIEEKATGKPIVEESANEQVSKDAAAVTDVAGGLAANGGNGTPSTPDPLKLTKPNYGGEKKYAQYPVNRTVTKTEPALGSLKNMAIAVLVNQDKVQDATPVENFLKSYVGDNPMYTAKVTSIAFDKTAEEEAKKSVAATSSRETMQQAMSLLPVIALLVVGFLVMKAIAKAAKSQTVTVHALADGSLALSGPSYSSGHAHSADAAGHLEAAVEERVHALSPRVGEDVGEIEQRTNKPLEQIKRMSHDRPESVAMLLKSWMLEERR